MLGVIALAALLLTALWLALAAAPAQAAVAAQAAPPLRAGVGKADIQPQTGYVLGGWTRADRTAQGQHTRLQSRALVLERGPRKVALVQVDLFMIPGGMVKQIGARLAARGFSEQNILISASHTHSGPGGFANFPTLNTTAPSLETAGDPNSFAALLNPAPADPQLYTFLVEQIEAAIRRADDDLDPALAGWGSSTLLGITRNRSLRLTSPTTASCASTARAASRRTPADTGTRSFRRQRAPSRQAAAQARCLRASRRGLTVLPARARSDWRLPAPRSPARASRRS